MITKIADLYQRNQVGGWLGEDIAKSQWNLLKSSPTFKKLSLSVRGSRRMMLYDVTRKVIGEDTRNYAQEIGDCVSFGAKNAIEYLICCEKLLKGDFEQFRPIFPPYLYGTGRIYVGGGQLGNEDGSLGSWMAEAVVKYGVLAADEANVPKYNGSVAKTWGGRSGRSYLDKFVDIAKIHPVRSAAQIESWDDLVNAICNGYPCTVASNQGFDMEAGSDGFHDARGSWAHQMCIVGVDDEYSQPHAIILNSWGDSHGRLKDFTTGENLPVGVLRVRKSAIESMIRAGETFAFSNFEGFPDQEVKLQKEMFKLI